MMVELSTEKNIPGNLGLPVQVLGTMPEMPGMPIPCSFYTHLATQGRLPSVHNWEQQITLVALTHSFVLENLFFPCTVINLKGLLPHGSAERFSGLYPCRQTNIMT